jgi:subtilisin family serine protease
VDGGAWDKGYTGEDVIVGVIDSGIWPEHPSFADDGSYSASPVGPLGDSRPNCKFGNTHHNPDDAPFTCNNKLLGARQMLDTYRLFFLDPDEFDSAQVWATWAALPLTWRQRSIRPSQMAWM